MTGHKKNKDSKPQHKIIQVVSYIVGAAVISIPMLLIMYLTFPYPVYLEDEEGTLDCDHLKEVVSEGKYDYLSYYYPEYFNLSQSYETVAHFESASSYDFTTCRHDIEVQRNSWCNTYVHKSLADLSLDTKIPSDEYELCSLEFNEAKKEINQPFDVRQGESGSAIKLGSGWVSLQSVEIRDPMAFSPWPDANMSMQCVVDGQWLSCKPFSDEEQALKEQERLLNIGYDLGSTQSFKF
ncbi:TPA: hypothetical protein ACGSTL_001281 [Vibrio parahaemolyticus]|uniref:hypothetical protein n=1 Tax=Vibrio campbellii TaxID=680 RepID=UPI001F0877B3|nr:hypothetical protein [Vibrio campbellii]UMM06699.1 hypothetical protein MKR81_27510 [Vibrio campbellii]